MHIFSVDFSKYSIRCAIFIVRMLWLDENSVITFFPDVKFGWLESNISVWSNFYGCSGMSVLILTVGMPVIWCVLIKLSCNLCYSWICDCLIATCLGRIKKNIMFLLHHSTIHNYDKSNISLLQCSLWINLPIGSISGELLMSLNIATRWELGRVKWVRILM